MKASDIPHQGDACANRPQSLRMAGGDTVLQFTATAICGPDLYICRGKIPDLKHCDVLGHEFMGLVAACETTNPGRGALFNKKWAMAGAGLSGHSHLYGGFADGQTEYVRIPKSNVGLLRTPRDF